MAKKLQVVNGDGDSTKIQWTWTERPDGTFAPGYTFNLVWGCEKVSPACRACYAEAFAKRVGLKVWGPANTTARRVMSATYWREPLKWQRKAAAMNETRKVFCSSMADVFEDHPTVNEQRALLWDLIAATPNLIWMLLTKRPENILRMVPPEWVRDGFPPNVWVGTTVENQEWADKRIPYLLRVPAVVRFLSCEPLLEAVEIKYAFGQYIDERGNWRSGRGVSLVIAGGESGHGARENDLAWSRSLRDQSLAGGACFFMKQYGAHPVDDGERIRLVDSHGGDMKEWSEDLRVRQMPAAYQPRKVAV